MMTNSKPFQMPVFIKLIYNLKSVNLLSGGWKWLFALSKSKIIWKISF